MADKRSGYTPFPNETIDSLMSLLSGAEYKIISVIIRQTLGWKKQWDGISLTIFMDKTGLSRQGVLDCVESLESNELILTDKKPGKTTRYALYGDTNEKARLVNSVDQYTQLTGQLIRQDLVNSVDRLREKLVNSVDTQKKGSKETNKTTTEVVVDDLPEKESETERRLKLVSGIKNAICDAFPDQFKGKPTDLSIRKALDEFKGDDKPILTACRVILEKEFVLDYPSPSNALKYVVATAKGDGGAVNYGYDKTYSDDPEVDSLERYLRKCVGFRNKEDQIYPCLVELAEKLKQPIEKVYAEREFLPLGMLETYKEFADT